MSIADFYLDFGIDGGDPNHMDNFLAAHAPRDGDGGAARGAGGRAGSIGKRKHSDAGATTCPACKKEFKTGDAMHEHLTCKQDATHKTYREENPSFATSKISKGSKAGTSSEKKTPAHVSAVPQASAAAIRAQVEFYLSDQALVGRCRWSGMEQCKDFPVLREMARGAGQWVLNPLTSNPRTKTVKPQSSTLDPQPSN